MGVMPTYILYPWSLCQRKISYCATSIFAFAASACARLTPLSLFLNSSISLVALARCSKTFPTVKAPPIVPKPNTKFMKNEGSQYPGVNKSLPLCKLTTLMPYCGRGVVLWSISKHLRSCPYKDPMKLSQTLAIMSNMVKDEHIDGEIFSVFLKQGVWERYG